ncbi:MAG: Hsp33 family molecular chaperone HslO [Dongiaceae bacterium]
MEQSTDNIVLAFQIESSRIRGRLVRLGSTLNSIIARHAYPDLVANLLAESIALNAGLANVLKFSGIFSLQIQGDGALPLIVADMTDTGHLRGYSQFTQAKIEALIKNNKGKKLTVPQIFGKGYLAFTIDQGPEVDRYQGIVALEGENLAESVGHYFKQSEQIDTPVKVAARKVGNEWRAGLLLLQHLPKEEFEDEAEYQNNWETALALFSSVTAEELTDPDLPATKLLYRLFHEEGLRLFTPKDLIDKCRCSRERMHNFLESLARGERQELTVDGIIDVKCEFCSRKEIFTAEDFSE